MIIPVTTVFYDPKGIKESQITEKKSKKYIISQYESLSFRSRWYLKKTGFEFVCFPTAKTVKGVWTWGIKPTLAQQSYMKTAVKEFEHVRNKVNIPSPDSIIRVFKYYSCHIDGNSMARFQTKKLMGGVSKSSTVQPQKDLFFFSFTVQT